jgi:NitT/TauT family transport system permease protein
VKIEHTLARPPVADRTWPFLVDTTVILCGLAFFFSMIQLGTYWMARPMPAVVISLSVRALPLYAFYSIARIAIAYLLSLIFAVSYGYIAAYNPRVEAWMIAVLDILQSIPVLSFLPGVMLAMMALIPGHQLGIEMGSILLIFTGQVWNMAFSFYSSLKSIPREMIEATRVYRFSAWQRFWQLEMPFAAIGLIWNSIVSVAGGWFFLIVCEMFAFKGTSFRLPGLGSYLQTAAGAGNLHALLWGLIVLVLIIVATDQLIWRPLIAWSDKFKFEQTESATRVTSPILSLLQRPSALTRLPARVWGSIEEGVYRRLSKSRECRVIQPIDDTAAKGSRLFPILLGSFAALVILWGLSQAIQIVHGVTWADIRLLLLCAGATWLRVNTAIALAALWTIPVGVTIGSNPRLARYLQPITQVVASVPATALFPVLMLGLIRIGGGLGVGSIALNVDGNAMVHPLQRDRRRNGHPLRPERGRRGLSLHPLAALDAADSAGNLSLSRHRHDYRLGRRMERLDCLRILPHRRSDSANAGPGSADQRRQRQRKFLDALAGHRADGHDGGHDEPPGLAAALPPCRDAV